MKAQLLVGAMLSSALLAACGGGGGSGGTPPTGGIQPTATPAPGLQGVPPSGISLDGLGTASSAALTVTQAAAGTITESDTCSNVAPVTPMTPSPAPSPDTAAIELLVTPRAPGSCSIQLTGSGGTSAGVPVTVALPDVTPSVQWRASLGPRLNSSSGKLNALLVDPTDGETMYVAGGVGAQDNVQTSAGVYKTADGGKTWTPQDSGLSDPTVNALWMDPHTPQTLVAATEFGGIFKSTNGADSWTQAFSTAPVYSLVSSGSTLYAATPSGVATSTDDGSTWKITYPTPNDAESIAVAGNTVYIGDASGNVYLSQNGSAPSKVYAFPQSPIAGYLPDVHELAVDSTNPTTVYASVDGLSNGVFSADYWVSTNGALTWTQIPIPAAYRGAQYITMSEANPQQVYVLGTGCLTSFSVNAALNGCGGYGDGRYLAPDDNLPRTDIPLGAAGSEPLLATGDQGAMIGVANGCCSIPLTAGLSVNIVRSLVVSGTNIAVTMQDFPPAYTADAGSVWADSATTSIENGFLYENPAAPSHCYLFDSSLHISSDGCQTFDDVTGAAYGRSDGGTTVMAFDASSPPRAYLATSNGVYMTSDGTTFAPTGWPISSPMNIAVDPQNSNTIFVSANVGGSAFGSVFYTNDGGKTWNTSTGILPRNWAYPGDAPVIAISPTHDWIVFAATATQLFRSTDGGKTFASIWAWSPDAVLARANQRRMRSMRNGENDEYRLRPGEASSTAPGDNVGEVLAFADNTPAGGVAPLVYLYPGSGLRMSTDYGTHWHDVSANAIPRWFSQVAFAHGVMYAATMGEGVLASQSAVTAAAPSRRRFMMRLRKR